MFDYFFFFFFFERSSHLWFSVRILVNLGLQSRWTFTPTMTRNSVNAVGCCRQAKPERNCILVLLGRLIISNGQTQGAFNKQFLYPELPFPARPLGVESDAKVS